MTIAVAASTFTNSVGIDTHIDMIGSSYQNYAQMINALSYIGTTNVRDTYDDLNDPAEYKQMAALLGLKFDFFIALGSAGLPWQLAQIEADPGIVSYVEGFNESDAWWQTYNGLTGIAATQAVQAAVYTAVKADAALAGVGVIQSSFASLSTFASYGNMTAYADYANTHTYFGTGNNPNGGNAANNLIALAQTVTPGKGTITTEAGYFTMPGNANGVDQLVQAKYLLDLLFEQAQAGVKLTYLWELADNYADPGNTNSEDHYGLFNADWTPKIAAVALHNLLQIMQDPGTGTTAPSALNYTLSGMPSTANSSLYEKSDGTFVLVLWNDVRLSGPTTQTDIIVAPVTVTLNLGQQFTRVTVYDPLTGTTAIQEFDNTSSVQIAVPDHPVIIELSQVAAPAQTGPNIAAPTQILTTPGQAVHVDGLSVSNLPDGTYTAQITSRASGLSLQDLAGHVLANQVSSVTLSGSLATINTELASLSYTGNTATGSDAITVAITDGTGTTTTRMIPVSVVAADAAVVSGGLALSVPATFATAAGSTSAVPNLTVADPYAATHSGNVTLTLRDTSGLLRVAAGSATVSGNGSNAVNVVGSFAQVTAALASLSYTAGATTGQDTVSFGITDQAGFASNQQTVVTVTPLPTLSGPSFMEVNPGTAASVARIVLTDTAAEAGANQVTVTVAAGSGTLSTPSSAGVTGSGTGGTGSLTLSGTVAAVDTALAGLTYTLASGATGDTITANATDLYGGTTTFSTEVDTVSVIPPKLVLANPINAAAMATVAAPYLSIQDPATAATHGRVNVTLSSSLGSFSTSIVAGVSVSSTANTFTLSGTVAAVNQALSLLAYTAGSRTGLDLVTIAVSDPFGSAATSQFKFNVIPRPTLTMPSAGLVRSGGSLAVKGITVTDDLAKSQGSAVTVKVTDTLGALSATASGASVSGLGTRSLTITGTVSQVNTALGTLAYAAGTRSATDYLTVTASDTYGGMVQQFLTETTAAPQFSLSSSPLLGTKQTTSLSGIKLTDACDGKVAGNMILHISTIANMGGSLSITNLSGVTQTGSGANAITLTGTLMQLNNALTTLTYTSGSKSGTDDVMLNAWNQLGAATTVNYQIGLGSRTVVIGNAATPQSVSGFSATGSVLLDLRQVMAGTGWDGQTATLSKYLQVHATSAGSMLAITPNGNSASLHNVALLQGVTVSLGDVQLHSLLIPDGSTATAGVTITDTGAGLATISGEQGAVATALSRATYTATGGTNADPTTNSLTVLGWNNVLDAGAGANFLNGLQPGDVFRLNAAGQGLDTISGFTLTNGDKIDVGRALSGLSVAADLSNVGRFLTATVSGTDTILSVDPTGGTGNPSAIARLMNVTTSVPELLSDHSLVRM